MDSCIWRPSRAPFAMAAVAVAFALGAQDSVAISQSGEQKDMRRVGHTDLQGRPAYHPDRITYPDGREILFVGTHSNTGDNGPRPNPLKPGSPVEANGTMVIDVTDPRNPVEKAHIAGPVFGGIQPGQAQTQSNRLCLGSDLPNGPADKNQRVYLLRNVQVNNAAVSGYEVWDVTDVSNPTLKSSIRQMRNTHKLWWECKTGIAYLPGSMAATATPPAPQWRQGQSMVVVDWSDPTAPPKYLRTYGLPGSQPGATGPVPTSLHGPISAYEHPKADQLLARGIASEGGYIGNRLYLAWGVGDDGVLQVLDRSKLLPPPYGTYMGPDGWTTGIPTNADLEDAQTSVLYMSPDQGGHTSFPVFGLKPKSYGDFTEFLTRDVVVLASESTADNCVEAPHWSFVVDITVENSKKDSPVFPPKRALPNPWQGPMVLSTMSVDPRAGEKYPRGNYCDRGARYGVHSSEENFRNPFYGRLTFQAYFTGGVRAWDIREPQAPVEVAFYVPESNALTKVPDGYMTNNLEVDKRGYVYAVDRNGAGMDILELHGQALKIGVGNK